MAVWTEGGPVVCLPNPRRVSSARAKAGESNARVHLQVVMHNVCDGLRIRGRSRAAAVDTLVDVGQFIRHTVCLRAPGIESAPDPL